MSDVEKKDLNKEQSNDFLAVILALIIPPAGVLVKRGLDEQFIINVLLTLFGYIPGIVHALYIILKK